MSRRTALLGALLGVAGLAAWNLVALQRAVPESVVEEASPAARQQDASSLSLERYPGPVADAASALSHFGGTLEWLARSWREDLGVDVHVVTLAAPQLAAEQLAPEVFALRKVGAEAPTGGLLVLVNPARREARIEVSYTLEPVLPDALVGRIANDQLAPYAAYRFAGMAVMDALQFLKDFTLQQAIEGKLVLGDAYRTRPAYAEKARFLSGGGGASVRVPSAEELAARDFKARVTGAQRERYAPSKEPLVSAEAFLRAQRDLAGDPSLELLTEGSQCMRRGYPLAPYEELERARRLEASRPWHAIVSADHAVVTSDSPQPGFVPVLLQRVNGLWRVDLVETWKSLFFGENGSYWLKNSQSPYAFGLGAFGSGEPHELEPWDLGDASIEQVLAALDAKEGALAEFLQGEVLFRNCFRALDALAHYQAASDAARGAHLFHETLGRRAEYLGFYDLAAEAYARIPDFAALDAARAHARNDDLEAAVRAVRRALARNPRDRETLEAMRGVLEASQDAAGAKEIAAQLAALAAEPNRYVPVQVHFDPPDPVLHLDAPTMVGTTRVFDHSFFTVTLENPSDRPVVLDRVVVKTAGSHDTSGLGDIKDYWTYPSGAHRLGPGESVTLDKTWGYVIDTKNEQIRYVFDVCWRGEGEPSQCRATGLDLFPR